MAVFNMGDRKHNAHIMPLLPPLAKLWQAAEAIRLRTLGYVAATRPPTERPSKVDKPKTQVQKG
eukprot:1613040-Amphidinium_carterae.1